jgi:hypothetical protein
LLDAAEVVGLDVRRAEGRPGGRLEPFRQSGQRRDEPARELDEAEPPPQRDRAARRRS